MKKLGKAKIDLEKDLWRVEGKSLWFHINRRLVDTRPDVKKFMAKYKKLMNEKRPSRRQPVEREQYFKERTELKKHYDLFWARVYKEILEESYEYPVPLRMDHDFDHQRQWLYCIYKGFIYQMDHQGLSDEAMVQAIEVLEARKNPASNLIQSEDKR